MSKLIVVLFFFVFSGSFLYSVENSIQNLLSSDNEVVLVAIQDVTTKKNKSAIPTLVSLINTNKNIKVQIAAISALGNMGTKKEPTNSLINIVKNSQDNQIIYACLLAIINLKDVQNANLSDLLSYLEKANINDIFIKDVISKVKAFVPLKNN